MKYSAQDKQHFFSVLACYKESRKLVGKGGNNEFIVASVLIWQALATVPKSYKRFVTQAERETI